MVSVIHKAQKIALASSPEARERAPSSPGDTCRISNCDWYTFTRSWFTSMARSRKRGCDPGISRMEAGSIRPEHVRMTTLRSGWRRLSCNIRCTQMMQLGVSCVPTSSRDLPYITIVSMWDSRRCDLEYPLCLLIMISQCLMIGRGLLLHRQHNSDW